MAKKKSAAQAKTEALIEKLEAGIKSVTDSESWQKWLDMQAQFHSYSANNSFLIMLQCPHASRVAGYRAWQKLGRQVRKGEKAIRILAPRMVTFTTENEDGEKEKRRAVRGFFNVSVFDVSQTEGEPLPEIAHKLHADTGAGRELRRRLECIAEEEGCRVVTEDLRPGLGGTYNHINQEITLNGNHSPDQQTKTLAHELAHHFMHELFDDIPQGQVETEAESVAYIIGQHFGLQADSYSFGYLAAWGKGETDTLKKAMQRIANTSGDLIERIAKMEETSAEAAAD